MIAKIEQDHQRFRQLIKGKIRQDLRKFLGRQDMIAREGKHLVSVPIYDVDVPTFRYGDNSSGIGMGEGDTEAGQGRTAGGEDPGKHLMEVDVSLDELADLLGEELKLPRIEPRGASTITTVKDRYSGIRPVGPSSLRHFKRTFREALKRQVMIGEYDPDDPMIVPVRRDMRYRSWTEVRKPQSNAAVILMMDVSGSMGDQQKELVRLTAFWIDTWLRRNYKGIQTRYIVHDIAAKEVDKATFFSIREDGGTRISSAYQSAAELIDDQFPRAEWNTYAFHFSDGDNSSESDNRKCIEILRDALIPACNLFGYCQVASSYGSGNFINVLHEAFPASATTIGAGASDSPLVTTRIAARDDIHDALRSLFGAGR
jgi:uncharacterized sporulation protein YeaH/YhbH (DUF444 family)